MRNGGLAWVIAAVGVAAMHAPRQETNPSTTAIVIPNLTFSFINDDSLQAVTCEAVNIYWYYSGPKGFLNLYATNVGVSQTKPAPVIDSTTIGYALPTGVVDKTSSNITVTVGTLLDPTVFGFKWTSVDVPYGWYILNATFPAEPYSFKSDPFYVYPGNDTSCTRSPLTSTSSLSIPKTTTSALPLISTLALASSTPLTAASQSNASAIGAITGAILALAIAAAAMIVTYVRFKRRRQRSMTRSYDKGSKGSTSTDPTRWNELGYADSRAALRSNRSGPYHQASNNSMGTVLRSDEGGVGAEKSSMHSKLDALALSQEDVTLSSLPVLKPSRSRTVVKDRPTSSSSTNTMGLSSHDHYSTPARDPISKPQSLESVGYPPPTPTALPIILSSQPNDDQRASLGEDSDPSLQSGTVTPVDGVKGGHRQSLGRKRKPVPVYEAELASPSRPPTFISPASPSSPLKLSSPTSGSAGHYSTRNHSLARTQEFGQPDPMRSNGTFGPGEKSLHFLIPDVPMSQ